MAQVKFFKVTSLPGTPVANAVYFVYTGETVDGDAVTEMYVTDSSGGVKAVANTDVINALIMDALASVNNMQLVADIAARDALTPTQNIMALVADASADADVTAGAALYFYDFGNTDWIKVAEYESMDVTVTWASISGKPSSSTADIDDAVSKKHTHGNIAVLNDLADDGSGNLQYDGNTIYSAEWGTNNW